MKPGYQHQRGGDIAIYYNQHIHDRGRILHVDVTDGTAASDTQDMLIQHC